MHYVSLLMFGCLVGMQHAFEADHLAAVAALGREGSSRRALVLRGGFWGLGHTITLFAICGVLLVLGRTISAHTEALLELLVGTVIVALGVNVIVTMWRRRVHVHVHEHDDGTAHLHLHTHEDDTGPHVHSRHEHEHEHDSLGLRRAMTVGIFHGAAGSAGLLILAATAKSVPEAVGFVAAFGVGSMIGMAALSFVVSYPLRWLEGWATWTSNAVHAVIGAVAMLIGLNLIVTSWGAL